MVRQWMSRGRSRKHMSLRWLLAVGPKGPKGRSLFGGGWLATPCNPSAPCTSTRRRPGPPMALPVRRCTACCVLRAACCERCVPYAQYIYAQLTRSACTLATYTCSLTRLLLTPKPVPLPNRCSEFLLTRVTFVCLPYGPAAAAYRFYFHRLHSPEQSGKAHPYP